MNTKRSYQRRAPVAPQITSDQRLMEPTPMADAQDQQSERPPMRAAMREDDPRARAAARTAELRGHIGDLDEGGDDFYVNPSDVPDGWAYEWKRKTVLNQEDPAYQVQLARVGWQPVPASRHPAYMPGDAKYATIERKGMVLMERPQEIVDEARARELRRARAQVHQKEEQLNAAPAGQFERANKDSSLVKVKKSYEAMPIPAD